MISKHLLSLVGAKKGYVLLVSQQVNSNLRQTFFKDGKMLSSRQSVINQDAGNITSIGKFARPEVERTLSFIRNQYQIDDNTVVDVHLLGSDAQIDSLESAFLSVTTNHYHVHRLKDITARLGLKEVPDKFADSAFAWIALNKAGVISHYGRKDEFVRFYYKLASSVLYAASVVVVLASLLVIEANISDGISYKESTSLLNKRTNEFKRVYLDKYQAYEELFSNARLMDAAVGMVDQIETNSHVSPLDFMIVLSKVVSSPQIGRVYIDRIDWSTAQVDEGSQKNNRTADVAGIEYKPTDITSSSHVRHVAVVRGRIPVTTNNYRDTVNRIDNIITLLNSSERIVDVSAIELPVEVRPEKKFASESVALTEISNREKRKDGLFSLKIVMKGPDHV
jgi:hypothetical protein